MQTSGSRCSPPGEAARDCGIGACDFPRFCAARLAVVDLDATMRELQRNGIMSKSATRAADPAGGVAWPGVGIRRTGDNLTWLTSAIIPQRSTRLPAATAWGWNSRQHRRLLFVSGQVPERSDGSVPEGFEAQCEQAWRNVIAVLASRRPRRRASGQDQYVPDRPKPGRGQPRHSPQDARGKRARVHGDDRGNRRWQMVAGDRGDRCGMNASIVLESVSYG